MKTLLMTYHNERYQKIADVTVPIMRAYCKQHGYDFYVGEYHEDPTRLDSYGDRGKITMFKEHYDKYDTICFMDVDVVIMNSKKPIRDLGDMPFLWTYDANGPCSGFWIAKCRNDVKLMLSTVQAQAPLLGAVRAKELGDPPRVTLEMEPRGTSDQTTMRALMAIPPYKGVLAHCSMAKAVGHCYFDASYYGWEEYRELVQYEPGDWLVTAPSVPLDRRLEILKAFAGNAQ